MPQEDKDEEKKDPNDRFANAKKKQWRCKGYVITEEMMLNGIEKREQEATGSKDKEDAKRITRALREKKGIVAAPKEEISKIIEREIRMKKKRDKIERRRARATADYGDEFEGSDVEVDVEATLRAEKEQKKKAKEEDHWDQSKTAARRKAAKEAAEKADAEEAAAAEAEKIAEAHRIEAEEAAKREAKSPKSSKAKRPGSSHGRKGGFNDTLKKVFDRFNDKAVPLESEAAKAAVIGLGLTNRQMQKLKAKFDEIDVDSSGSIDAEELLGEIGEERGPITDALFQMMDVDGNGTVDFEEYIGVLSSYCIYTESDILQFVFNIFDVDKGGTLDEREFMDLCVAVNRGKPAFPGNFGSALEMFDINADGVLDFGEFTQLARTYPLLLYPAFRLQDSMQRCTLGTRDWQLIFEANVRQQQKDEFARLFPGRKVPKQWFEKCPWRQLFYSMGRLHTGRVDPDYISKARPNAVRRAEEKRLEAEANARMGVSGGDANKVYKVGDLVEAKKDGQGDWLAGTVDDVTDGKKGKTYLVVFADGGQDPEAKAANMKPR